MVEYPHAHNVQIHTHNWQTNRPTPPTFQGMMSSVLLIRQDGETFHHASIRSHLYLGVLAGCGVGRLVDHCQGKESVGQSEAGRQPGRYVAGPGSKHGRHRWLFTEESCSLPTPPCPFFLAHEILILFRQKTTLSVRES